MLQAPSRRRSAERVDSRDTERAIREPNSVVAGPRGLQVREVQGGSPPVRQAKGRRHPRRGFGEQPMARSPLGVMGKGVTSGGVPGEPTGTQKCSDRARLALVVEGKTCPGRVPARPGEWPY